MATKKVRFDGEAKRLAESVPEYVRCLSDQYKAATVENKEISLRKMLRTLGVDRWTHEVSPQDMTKVWNVCGSTRGNNSLIIDHQSFKHFFSWCEDMGYRVGVSPMKHIRAPKPTKKERRRVPADQFPALISSCVSPRDRMYVATGLYSLCRKVEMYTIKWGDVDRDAGEIIITRHKTGEDDVLAIGDEMEHELDYYEDWYRWITDTPKFQQLNPSWFVTPSFTRPSYTSSGIVKGTMRPAQLMIEQSGGIIVNKALRAIGFPTRDLLTDKSNREGAHTLRRSAARALYDAFVAAGDVEAVRKVQQQLGHKHQWQTLDYIGAQPDRIKRNNAIRGKVMYPQAVAAREELEASLTGRRPQAHGHLRVVS